MQRKRNILSRALTPAELRAYIDQIPNLGNTTTLQQAADTNSISIPIPFHEETFCCSHIHSSSSSSSVSPPAPFKNLICTILINTLTRPDPLLILLLILIPVLLLTLLTAYLNRRKQTVNIPHFLAQLCSFAVLFAPKVLCLVWDLFFNDAVVREPLMLEAARMLGGVGLGVGVCLRRFFGEFWECYMREGEPAAAAAAPLPLPCAPSMGPRFVRVRVPVPDDKNVQRKQRQQRQPRPRDPTGCTPPSLFDEIAFWPPAMFRAVFDAFSYVHMAYHTYAILRYVFGFSFSFSDVVVRLPWLSFEIINLVMLIQARKLW